MSGRRLTRALARLTSAGALLALERGGPGYGVFASGNRRRRPLVRLSAEEVRGLDAEGALAAVKDGYVLSGAGRARVRRDSEAPNEAFVAQHRAIETRSVMDADGAPRTVRGHEPNAVLKRLTALRNGDGAPWLSALELAMATRLRADWERGQIGLVRGSDWSAGPMGASARGPGNAREGALAVHCDARRRVEEALAALAPQLRRVVERVCLHEEGLETLERAEGWPARSGKIALKLGLAQLAAR